MWAVFGLFTGLATTILHARDRAVGRGHGPRGRHADAQLAARRLLPDRGARRRLRLPPRWPTRSARSSARSSAGSSPRRSAGGCRSSSSSIPTLVFVILGLRLKEPGRGHFERRAGGRRARRSSTPTRRRRRGRSRSASSGRSRTLRRIWYSLPFLAASVIGLASLTSLYYEEVFDLAEAQRGFVAGDRRARADRRHPARHPARLAADAAGPRARAPAAVARRGRHRRRVDRVRAGARALASRSSPTSLISGLAALLAPGIFASLSLAIPPKVRSLGLLDGVAVHPARAHRALHRRRHRRPLRHPAGLLIMVPVFLIGALDPLVGLAVREGRHQPGVDLDRGAGRGALPAVAGRGEAAARPQRRRAATTTCRCSSTSTSRSTRARSSRCSAPTAPGSRRC